MAKIQNFSVHQMQNFLNLKKIANFIIAFFLGAFFGTACTFASLCLILIILKSALSNLLNMKANL